jgi:CRISP-associated protein Cas1
LRPRCDQFDIASIRAAIARGETSERKAYQDYAATAGRPYARSTFSLMLRRKLHAIELEPAASDNASPIDHWRDRSPVKPKIVALGPGGGLRVKAGALIVFDGALTLTYSKAAKPPLAIILSTAGGYLSAEAIRFAVRAKIAIIILNRAHGFITVLSAAPKANAALLRAQVCANPVPIARAIVAAKIAASRQVGALIQIDQFMIALDCAASLDRIRNIEAQAARLAWPNTPALRWEAGSVPTDWRLPWLARMRLDARTKSGARHPLNALLNAAFAVTAGRLAAYLAATGMSPAVGFLHSDKPGRWSLAWDAIEPLRPMIEVRVFRLVERERFASNDFIRASDGSLRLAAGLLSAVLNECAPPSQTLVQSVRWLARIVVNASSLSGADAPSRFLPRSAQPVRPCARLSRLAQK